MEGSSVALNRPRPKTEAENRTSLKYFSMFPRACLP